MAATESNLQSTVESFINAPPVNPEAGQGPEVLLQSLKLDSLSTDMLAKLVNEATRRLDQLDLENRLLDAHLNRVQPSVGGKLGDEGDHNANQGQPGGPQQAQQQAQGNGKELQNRREERQKKRRGEKTKETEERITLTTEQKAEIASREVEEMRAQIEREREQWEKVIDTYKAEMEEIEMRLTEIKKAAYEFRRDIVQQARNPRTGKVMAERVVRYFEDKQRAKDATIEKIRLKNATLKVQKNKLQMQLKQKEEMGEVLHGIDFDQLKIENQQYLAKIEERNNELLKLKMTSGNTVQILNFYKKRLQALTAESIELRQEIEQRQELLSKLDTEMDHVERERSKASTTHNQLRAQMEEFRVPEVMDYVIEKAGEEQLRRKVRNWERKVEIANMAYKREQRHLRVLLDEDKRARRQGLEESTTPRQKLAPLVPAVVTVQTPSLGRALSGTL